MNDPENMTKRELIQELYSLSGKKETNEMEKEYKFQPIFAPSYVKVLSGNSEKMEPIHSEQIRKIEYSGAQMIIYIYKRE